jgi:hypothetical protein
MNNANLQNSILPWAIAPWSNRFKTSDGKLLWHLSNIGYIGNSNSIIGKLSHQNTHARITVILR